MKEKPFDEVIHKIADYVANKQIKSELAYTTAWHALVDSLGCAALALRYPECAKLLGSWQEDTIVKNPVHVPGTNFECDLVKGAFDIGVMIRWLDYNDTWLAAEWAHPSDNLGAILACAEYRAQRGQALTMHEVLTAMIKCYEIQGVLALKNAMNKFGFDHVAFVKIASTAVATHLLGGSERDIAHAVSQAWIDGHSLRTYRHAPNTGSRKSWAAGDATSGAVMLALVTLRGENGYASALTAPKWGFQDSYFRGEPIQLEREFDCYVMENVLFKISYPAEFHAQTAVEAAIHLHPQVKGRLDQISKVELETQEAGKRIIDKTGPLNNYADRDHCLQYMVACGLIFGELTAEHYQETIARDPRIDALRAQMVVTENPRFTEDYFAADKRAIPNSVRVHFRDGTTTERILVEYPIGHRRRRDEGIPFLIEKFQNNMATRYPRRQLDEIFHVMLDQTRLEQYGVAEFMEMLRLP